MNPDGQDLESAQEPDRDLDDGRAAEGRGGVRSRVAARYGSLARAMRRGGAAPQGEAPTIHDAATAAVEHKQAGRAVAGDVRAPVEAQLGVDLSAARVHDDPLANQASAAMGARAFAYGDDVFLGPKESDRDLGLMAHELTHVAQQGAAHLLRPQRQVEVGAASSPAETHADAVATAVTSGAPPAALLVDDGPVQPGQMLKSTFIEQLRGQVTAAASEALGPLAVLGCPHIDHYFARYSGQPAAVGEALLRRYAPATRSVRTAAEMLPLIVDRVRDGVRQWQETGVAPADIGAAEPAAFANPAAGPAETAHALRVADGGETIASLEAELGAGQPIDGATASRMTSALGADLADVRIHTGPVAARMAADAGALAFAAGGNIVMGAGAPAAGTLEGDALLAHELAHTAQQRDAARDPLARRQPLAGDDAGAETDADRAAAAAIAHLHGEERPSLVARMQQPLRLSRCEKANPPEVTARRARIRTLLSDPNANAAAVATELSTTPGDGDRARVALGMPTVSQAQWLQQIGNYDNGGTILTAMRDALVERAGGDILERTRIRDLRALVDAAITARTAAPAPAAPADTSDLGRLQTMLAPELANAQYTAGAGAINTTLELFPGAAAARHGHVYFDPSLPAPAPGSATEAGVTNTGTWGTGATTYHFFAGYIRLGRGALAGSPEAARVVLFHEWSHYRLQCERNAGAPTDPDLALLREEVRDGTPTADADEHMIVISLEIERFGDALAPAELQSSVWYLGVKMATAQARFRQIAIDRLVRWANHGTAEPRRRPPRTARQRKLLTAITGAAEPGLAPLRTAIDVAPSP